MACIDSGDFCGPRRARLLWEAARGGAGVHPRRTRGRAVHAAVRRLAERRGPGSHPAAGRARQGGAGEPSSNRHAGLSQLIVPLDAPGVRVRPIRLLTGEEHFNEVLLDGVFVPDDMVLGEIGDGWRQVTAELAVERSGPERFLSTYPL